MVSEAPDARQADLEAGTIVDRRFISPRDFMRAVNALIRAAGTGTGLTTDQVNALIGAADLEDLANVDSGTPGSADDGKALVWDNTAGMYVLDDVGGGTPASGGDGNYIPRGGSRTGDTVGINGINGFPLIAQSFLDILGGSRFTNADNTVRHDLRDVRIYIPAGALAALKAATAVGGNINHNGLVLNIGGLDFALTDATGTQQYENLVAAATYQINTFRALKNSILGNLFNPGSSSLPFNLDGTGHVTVELRSAPNSAEPNKVLARDSIICAPKSIFAASWAAAGRPAPYHPHVEMRSVNGELFQFRDFYAMLRDSRGHPVVRAAFTAASANTVYQLAITFFFPDFTELDEIIDQWGNTGLTARLNINGAPVNLEPGLTLQANVAVQTVTFNAMKSSFDNVVSNLSSNGHGQVDLFFETREGVLDRHWTIRSRATVTFGTTVRKYPSSWATEGNTDTIPAAKLTNAPGYGWNATVLKSFSGSTTKTNGLRASLSSDWRNFDKIMVIITHDPQNGTTELAAMNGALVSRSSVVPHVETSSFLIDTAPAIKNTGHIAARNSPMKYEYFTNGAGLNRLTYISAIQNDLTYRNINIQVLNINFRVQTELYDVAVVGINH